jgi:outer membrane protein assembly factor BamA
MMKCNEERNTIGDRSVAAPWGRLVLCWLLFAGVASGAELKLEGFGLLRNFELRGALMLLLDDGTKRTYFNASFIEDAALVLNSELVEEGYFAAEVEAVWRDPEGEERRARLDAQLTQTLPRDARATELRLIARPGVRATVQRVRITGLEAIAPKEARRFFRTDAGLFTPDSARAWSEASMRRGAEGLAKALRGLGYMEARVEVKKVDLNEASGRVELDVLVNEGPLWRVADAGLRLDAGEREAAASVAHLVGGIWIRTVSLDASQALRREFEQRGFPDVTVAWEAEPGEPDAATGVRPVRVTARVGPGVETRVSQVRFEGMARTRAGLLEERTRDLRAGDLFDPAEVENARLRLARLGVFRRVEVVEQDTAAGERAVTFVLREEAAWEAAWMLGYGSYEQVRAGVEVSRRNVWGLAHRTRLEAVQSLKGTRADYRYTVPTLFSDTVEATGRVFGLLREEPSFDRVEYGAAVEARREVPWIKALGTVGFTYEVLSASDVALGTTVEEVDEATVASFDLGLTKDRRDNPIRPTRGVRWSAQAQLARPELGGEVTYERLEAAWSWHRPLGEGRWLHAGVSQGLLFDRGNEVPLNKLFFPGGESSIRGYAQGEATQRDAAGRFVGVRSAWLVNLEFEQLVTGRWTAVFFADALGTAVRAEDWPGEETLGSAGLGVRYQSPIGPIRLEYGHNLNPRSGDPDGTLHFSIGFPF